MCRDARNPTCPMMKSSCELFQHKIQTTECDSECDSTKCDSTEECPLLKKLQLLNDFHFGDRLLNYVQGWTNYEAVENYLTSPQ